VRSLERQRLAWRSRCSDQWLRTSVASTV